MATPTAVRVSSKPLGAVEAVDGRPGTPAGIAFGFRSLNNYILRSLIHSGQLHHHINAL